MLIREEAKIRAELYSALADSKTIQVKHLDGTWTDMEIDCVDCFTHGLKYHKELILKIFFFIHISFDSGFKRFYHRFIFFLGHFVV